ncbi:MAG: hypothetical protein IIY88_04955, partial [Eubacterium sp.]|nr:hypothetical protein [Eubacterium sp.]
MNRQTLIELKKVFESVKSELGEIRGRVKELDRTLDEGRLVPQEMSAHLQELLKRHSEQSALLVSLGAELSIDLDSPVAEIETELDRLSETERIASLRDVVLDFFRLTAEAENVRKALDAAKQTFAEKCRTYDGSDSSFIEPYKTVVANAKSSEELSDDDYDTIKDNFETSVLRAADRKQLFIDESTDVSAYLDDSCELLRSQESADGSQIEEEPIIEVADTPPEEGTLENGETGADISSKGSGQAPADTGNKNGGEQEYDGSAEDAGSDDTADAPAEDETLPQSYPLGDGYSGYADSTTIEYKDVPAKELGAKQFISMCKQKPEALDALFVFSHQIFLDDEDMNISSESYMSPASTLCDYLLNHGYLAKVTVDHGTGSGAFCMLTSKAWECYEKSDVIRFFKSIKHVHTVPEALRIRPRELTPVIALRLELIHDYFCKKTDKRNYGVFPDHPDHFISANRIDDSQLNTIVCAGVFEKDQSAADIETLKSIIEYKEESEFRIIVLAAEDIALLSGSLGLDDAAKNRTRYCIHGDPDTLYDGDGRQIGTSDKKEPGENETAAPAYNKPEGSANKAEPT